MKKLSKRIQRINEAATQVRQVIEAAPAQVEHLRHTVTSAALQLHKLRSDITSGIATLRAETDPQLLETLREIDSAREILKDAGAELQRMDLDLGPNRRLVVELRPTGRLDVAKVRSLASIHAGKPALKALLEALPKCQHLAEEVRLESLAYKRVVVEIGLLPSVRMGWSAEPEHSLLRTNPTAMNQTETGKPADAFSLALDRQILPAPGPFTAPTVNIMPVQPVDPPNATVPLASDSASSRVTTAPSVSPARVQNSEAWSVSALARFKKMPDLRRP